MAALITKYHLVCVDGVRAAGMVWREKYRGDMWRRRRFAACMK